MNSIRARRLLLSVVCSFVTKIILSQNVAINASGTSANLSAILDLDGVTSFTGPNGYKGLLIPRMTSAQRTGIVTLPAAAQGLVVYQTDGIEGFYYNISTTTTPNWLYLTSSATGAWLTTGNTGTTPSSSAIGIAIGAGQNYLGTSDAKDLVLGTNDLERMRIKSTGIIGIGIAPIVTSHIIGSFSSTFGFGFSSQGILYSATSTNTAANNNHTGAQFQGYSASTSKVKNLYGVEGDAFMGASTATGLATGRVVGVYGTAGAISGIASTTVGEVYGVLGSPQLFDPLNSTNLAGVASQLTFFSGAATVTNASLFKGICSPGDIASGTITNLYGINISVLSKTGGTVTNAYGAYIDAPTAGTNNYGAYIGGKLMVGTTTGVTNAMLSVKDGHIQVSQTTAPTIAATANAGTAATATLLAGSNDIVGQITLTEGTAAWAIGVQCTVTFNKTYTTAPIVLLTAVNSIAAGANRLCFASSTTTGFSINFGNAALGTAVYIWNYMIIEP